MVHSPTFEAKATSISRDTDVILVAQSKSKKLISARGPYTAVLTKLNRSETFRGAYKSMQFVRFGGKRGAQNVLFVGVGPEESIDAEKMRRLGGMVQVRLQGEKSKAVSVPLEGTPFPTLLIRAFAEGIALKSYEFKKYKSKKEPQAPFLKVGFQTKAEAFRKELHASLGSLSSVNECVNLTRDWSNEPNNYGTPEYYALEAKKLATKYGLKCKILSEADCKKEKMNLFLAVGQGSAREGKVIVLEYNPKGVKNPKTVALVGKGITFDTGGISLKPGLKMEDMKHDMTGAATCMGAILLAAELKSKNRVIAILGMTENMPDGDAITPGHVITARNGKTVEIQNTDAEGRLILADLLDYAHDFKPDAIVNVATLTGAASIALGKCCCGIMGNDDGLVEGVRAAGSTHGERLWQLPLYEDYLEDIISEIADLKNIGMGGQAGTIIGGKFLEQFIKKGVKWAHLDIATTAWDVGYLPYFPKKGASGAYVRTLAEWASRFE